MARCEFWRGEGKLAAGIGDRGLDRYVLPVDQSVPLDAHGFLDIASLGSGFTAMPEAEPYLAGDLVEQVPCFVLLAAGGAGKTFVMDWLCRHEPGAAIVNLKTRSATEIRDLVRSKVVEGVPVYLDALDEVAYDEPAVFRVLAQELTTPTAAAVRWRLACRPATWSPELSEALKSAFPGPLELKLLPLTRPAAERAVSGIINHPGEFMTALASARLGRLAASPQRLLAAAGQWATEGKLPGSHPEAISYEIGQFLAETSRNRRQPSLPADRRRQLAGRLGAITTFSGISRFAIVGEEMRGIAGVAELPSTPEPEEPGNPITPAEYTEILSTDLFDAAADATLVFGHQQYAEYLAAEYLINRDVTGLRLNALLGAQSDALLPGLMAGVAAWLAAIKPALVADFISANPLALAHTLPDWSGGYLLTTLAHLDPTQIQGLAPETWGRWAPVIVGAWDSSRDGEQRLRRELVDLASPPGFQHILDAALGNLDALADHGGNLLHGLYAHLCPALAPQLAERLSAGRYSGQLACALLDMLIEYSPQAATSVCRDLRSTSDAAVAHVARLGFARLDPVAVVDELEISRPPAGDLAGAVAHLSLLNLDEQHLGVLARLLVQAFPFSADPPEHWRLFTPDGGHGPYQIRDGILQRLSDQGQVAALEELARSSDVDQNRIGWYLREARARAADLTFSRPNPAALLKLVSRGDARLVRRSYDLLEVIVEQLSQIQHDLTYTTASRQIWDFHSEGAAPHGEDEITDWIRDRLKSRLTSATVLDREIQVVHGLHGVGTRIVLTATAPTATQPAAAARVLIEAKLVNNPSLMTGMHNQLIRRYLIPEGIQHGIYLVYWIPSAQRPVGQRYRRARSDMNEIRRQLEGQVTDVEPGLHIRPFILDITHR